MVEGVGGVRGLAGVRPRIARAGPHAKLGGAPPPSPPSPDLTSMVNRPCYLETMMHLQLVSKTTARSGSSTCGLTFQPFTAYWQPILVDPDAHDFYVLRLSSPQEEWHPQVSQLAHATSGAW